VARSGRTAEHRCAGCGCSRDLGHRRAHVRLWATTMAGRSRRVGRAAAEVAGSSGSARGYGEEGER
jgi:hypothetical protein